MSYIRFGCKPLTNDLIKNGFYQFKKSNQFPKSIILYLMSAKNKSSKLSDSNEGKIALGFLLGFYDGDGHFNGGKGAEIYNTKKNFLLQLKDLYEIKNEIRLDKKKQIDENTGKVLRKNCWRLAIGPDLFDEMISSYSNSMNRKRNNKKIK